ncbi:MAG TPA: type VI secretion system tube protein Hcp [Steroidobacteraceae bacterium]|nr:type VI secretion system tube protein Hcp [Steroidobacteraceae bacterium]
MLKNLCASMAVAAVLVAPSAGAAEYFVRVDGIPGTSTYRGMEDYVQVESWSFGFKEGVCQGLTFVKTMDASSAAFTVAALSGVVYPFIVVVARKPGQQPFTFMRLTLNNAVFTSFTTGGTTNDGVPIEQISAKPTSVKTELFEQDIRGGKVVIANSRVDCPPT